MSLIAPVTNKDIDAERITIIEERRTTEWACRFPGSEQAPAVR